MSPQGVIPPGSALAVIEAYLREARPGVLSAGWATSTLADMGLDSLFAVELQMELEVRCDVPLGGTTAANNTLSALTLQQLAAHIETLWAARPAAP